MTYDIVLSIEQGSLEDRILQGTEDPKEFILSLVRESLSKGKKRLAEDQMQQFLKLDPSFELAAQYSDDQLRAMQLNARKLRRRGTTARA
ncbi:MAG TPA: hypothetical protein VK934_04780 [Fimbriimonas sp.]|nr:hypothetical protein [Fimbriimonas sp.]